MPIKKEFQNYTYFGEQNKDNNYQYDESYFNGLIKNRQYTDAARYLKNFTFKDPDINRQFESNIYNIEREGRKLEAIYSRIENSDQLAAVDFYDRVFLNGGLEHLSEDNEYLQDFKKYKDNLGSSGNKRAKYLQIEFKPENRTVLGIDWLAKDNEFTFDNFCKQSGLDRTILESAGVKVVNKDGSTFITFSKDNPYANQILYNAYKPERSLMPYYQEMANPKKGIGESIWSYIENKINPFQGAQQNTDFITGRDVSPMHGIDENGNIIAQADASDLYGLQRQIEWAKQEKEKLFKDTGLDSSTSPIILMGNVSPEMEVLSIKHDRGEIDDTAYKTLRDKYLKVYENEVIGLSGANNKMYSNWNSEDFKNNDETLREMTTEQRQEIIQHISGYPSKTSYQYAIHNDEAGLLVTIGSTRTTKNTELPGRIQVFIPGLFTDKAMERMNGDTRFRAMNELSNMELYNYKYKTIDGDNIIPIGRGLYDVKDNNGKIIKKEISKSQALTYIDKDMIKESSARALKYQYLNKDGKLINKDAFIEHLQRISLKAANSLYNDTPDLTFEDIYNKEGAPYSQNYYDNLQFDKYNKAKEYFDIYSYIYNYVNNRYN